MSASILPQIENSIERLPLKDQLSLLEWLVKKIRIQTTLQQLTEETELSDEKASKGISELVDKGEAQLSFPSEQIAKYQDSDAALQETVARIKSRPPNPDMIIEPTMTIEEVVALWEANPPTDDDIPPDEWDRLWAEFEADLKATDRAKDIAEGRF